MCEWPRTFDRGAWFFFWTVTVSVIDLTGFRAAMALSVREMIAGRLLLRIGACLSDVMLFCCPFVGIFIDQVAVIVIDSIAHARHAYGF
jgi:hypothetical protein